MTTNLLECWLPRPLSSRENVCTSLRSEGVQTLPPWVSSLRRLRMTVLSELTVQPTWPGLSTAPEPAVPELCPDTVGEGGIAK